MNSVCLMNWDGNVEVSPKNLVKVLKPENFGVVDFHLWMSKYY